MGRISRGWALTQESWDAVQADRSLLVFPIVSAVAALVVFVGFVLAGAGVGIAVNGENGSMWPAVPFLVVGLYLLIVISQFCAVALTFAATTVLDGGSVTFRDGVRAARGRLSLILQWSLVQLIVGALISAIQAVLREGLGSLVSSLIGGLANASWSVATFFVVPVLALEGVGPRDAIKRSTSILRERWGEGLTGSASIGLIVGLFGFLPAFAFIAAGAALTDNGSNVGGAVLIAIGFAIVAVAALLSATLNAVFRVALYRFATTGQAGGHFRAEHLAGAFQEKRSSGIFKRLR